MAQHNKKQKRKAARGKPRQARVFDAAFKENVVRRMLAGEDVSAIGREFDVQRSVLYRWVDAYRAEGRAGLSRPHGRPPGGSRPNPPPARPLAAAEARIAELERLVAKQSAQLSFLEKVYTAVSALPGAGKPGKPKSSASSAKKSRSKARSKSSKPVK